jgi:hypothetical protein
MEIKKSIIQIAKKTKSRNKSEREVYAHYVELGMCTTCHKQAAEDGSTRCGDCNELRKQKFFAPRTDENKVTITISPKERQGLVLAKLKENKILFKSIGKNLFKTTTGIKFATMTITYFKDAVTKGRVYRIRNELKIDCDFYVAYCPENEKYYIIKKGEGASPTIYFSLYEIDKFNDRFDLLLRG